MYEKDGRKVSLAQATTAASRFNQSVEEWAAEKGFVLISEEPGKTNDLAPTANAGSGTMTADGESILADTSLEQLENQPPKSYLIKDGGGVLEEVEAKQAEEQKIYDEQYNNVRAYDFDSAKRSQNKPEQKLTEPTKEQSFNIELEEDDLDLEAQEANFYFNKNNDNQFVSQHYDVAQLEQMGVNIKDFQGYLNKVDFSKDFSKKINDGSYESSVFNSGAARMKQEREGAIQKDLDLRLQIENYLEDTDQKANKKAFLEDYNSNPDLYKSINNFEEGFKIYIDKEGAKTLYNGKETDFYFKSNFEYSNLQNSYNNDAFTKEAEKQLSQNIAEGFIDGAQITVAKAFNGFFESIESTEAFIAESVGLDYLANRKRIALDQKREADAFSKMSYMRADGKGTDVNGKVYIKDKDGLIYDTEAGIVVNRILAPAEIKDISLAIDSRGEDLTDYSLAGGAAQMGTVVGNIVYQLLGAKGSGAARSGTSSALVARAKGFKNAAHMRKYTNMVNKGGTNLRNVKNVETFGKALPFDARQIDAIMFQSFYGAQTGYEGTLAAAKKAGLSDLQSKSLARMAAKNMGALYGITGPINPRLPLLDKLDNMLVGSGTFRRAIEAFKTTGKTKDFNKVIAQWSKEAISNATNTAKGIISAGGKELVQENIQQAGEFLLVNKKVNAAAGIKLLKEDYTVDDIIETSILSFAAGGLMGAGGGSTSSSQYQRLIDLNTIGGDINGSRARFDVMVARGKMTEDERDGILQQAGAVHKQINKLPRWLAGQGDAAVEASVLQTEIESFVEQKSRMDKAFHGPIDVALNNAEQKLDALTKKAAAIAIDKETETVEKILNTKNNKNVVSFNSAEEMRSATRLDGTKFTEDEIANADGIFESAGVIYINKDVASSRMAVSVASHELLHKVLYAEFKDNPKAKQIVDEFKQVLKDEGVFDVIDKKMDLYRKRGIDIDGTSADEWMTALSDAISKDQVSFNDFTPNVLKKISDIISNIWAKRIGSKDLKFKNGRQVFDFIRDYQSSLDLGQLSAAARAKLKTSEKRISKDIAEKEAKTKREDVSEKIKSNSKNSFSFNEDEGLTSPSKKDLFSVTTNVFNEAAGMWGLDLKLNSDGTSAFTKEEWDAVSDETKLGIGFVLGETWTPYVSYLMQSRKEVPGFDEYANQIIERTSTGIQKGDDGIPFLIKTFNPEGGAKLSTHIFGQVARRLQGVINKQDGFGEITVDAVSDKPGAKELVQEESAPQVEEVSKYRNLVRRRVITSVAMSNMESKIIPILRVLKTPMNASVSNNVTTKPWVNELRLQLGKQLDLIVKQEMGGVKGGELRRFLLKNKTAILENMTTGYLAGAMPFAVQKSVSGVYTSNWQGQKIDRETTLIQKAGRTSGNELVRRLPKVSFRVSDAEFLGAIVGPGGNPIRGRKESLAKAIAEELALDIISEKLKDADSDISKAFETRQESLGVDINESTVNEVLRDFERGTSKWSESDATKAMNDALNVVTPPGAISLTMLPADATEEQKDEAMQKISEYRGNQIDALLSFYAKSDPALETMPKLNTIAGQNDMLFGLEDVLFPLGPKLMWRSGNRGGGAFTASANNLGRKDENGNIINSNSEIKKDWNSNVINLINTFKNYAPPIGKIDGINIDFKAKYYKKLMGDAAMFDASVADGDMADFNTKNAIQHRIMTLALFEAVKQDRTNIKYVAKYLHLAVNNTRHLHRLGAQVVGRSDGFVAGKKDGVLQGVFEHAMQSSSSMLRIIDAMLLATDPKENINFEKRYDVIMSQYKLIALSQELNIMLSGDLKNNMPKDWDMFVDLWVDRLTAAGINLESIKMLTGKPLSNLTASEQQIVFNEKLKPFAREISQKITAQEKEIAENSKMSISEKAPALSAAFNEMIERDSGISATQGFSEVQAKLRGKKIGKYKFFSPFADDFRGLTSYTFAGKGKQGEADQKFFEDNLIKPYQKGINAINIAKQTIKKDFTEVVKIFKAEAKQMRQKLPGSDFTYDQALRVYLWTRQGMEVPGMTNDDTIFLNQAIKNNPKLIEFADAILLASKQGEWMAPSEYWLTETVLSDLNNMSERVGRATYLAEFIAASEVIFSPENLNKIQAVYGKNHADAIKDSLYAMRTGTNRPEGTNATVNRWNNWLNQSTGAIMFFNRRSAVLQLLSTANFINWSDNNPLKAAMAFANQKQFWTDFAMIFNSAKLKERRSGLKNDVNAAELSNAVQGSTNKAAAALNYLLTIGFKPTQIADSFAIASGGASFYRNRVKTYLKQGMSQKEAEALAFEEFSSTADEAQQSSDPMLVSSQQRSPLGRTILAFQNTPMQYTRLMKKAGQDLINGRGDPKTNISKIIYYGAIQNLIFASLQSALFAFIPGFDDDEDEDPEKRQKKLGGKEIRIVNSMIDSLLKGSGLTGAVIATIKNTIMEYKKQKDKGFLGDHAYTIIQALSISPPLSSKVRKIYSAATADKYNKDAMTRGASVMADGRLNLSPYYSIFGNLVSATLNVPLDRVVDEVTSIVEATDARNTGWQRLALALGWKTWDVNAKNEEHDLLKIAGGAQRKKDRVAKSAATRAKNKAIEEARLAALTPAERAAERRATAIEKRAKARAKILAKRKK